MLLTGCKYNNNNNTTLGCCLVKPWSGVFFKFVCVETHNDTPTNNALQRGPNTDAMNINGCQHFSFFDQFAFEESELANRHQLQQCNIGRCQKNSVSRNGTFAVYFFQQMFLNNLFILFFGFPYNFFFHDSNLHFSVCMGGLHALTFLCSEQHPKPCEYGGNVR